jgi:hypothetical protein
MSIPIVATSKLTRVKERQICNGIIKAILGMRNKASVRVILPENSDQLSAMISKIKLDYCYKHILQYKID